MRKQLDWGVIEDFKQLEARNFVVAISNIKFAQDLGGSLFGICSYDEDLQDARQKAETSK
ncbi:MAG: hypothetical protein ACUZ8N_04935 [Candidatus Scalindua sp.]